MELKIFFVAGLALLIVNLITSEKRPHGIMDTVVAMLVFLVITTVIVMNTSINIGRPFYINNYYFPRSVIVIPQRFIIFLIDSSDSYGYPINKLIANSIWYSLQ